VTPSRGAGRVPSAGPGGRKTPAIVARAHAKVAFDGEPHAVGGSVSTPSGELGNRDADLAIEGAGEIARALLGRHPTFDMRGF
jgi:hypothetical protein